MVADGEEQRNPSGTAVLINLSRLPRPVTLSLRLADSPISGPVGAPLTANNRSRFTPLLDTISLYLVDGYRNSE